MDDLPEIQLRDKYQFDLISDYRTIKGLKKNTYSIELYIFIPDALQINKDTYSKEQFYHDHTNLIRFKTPVLTLDQLCNSQRSPLKKINTSLSSDEIKFQLKLFANIARSQIRDKTAAFIENINTDGSLEGIDLFLNEIEKLRETFDEFRKDFIKACSDPLLKKYSSYIDEFLTLTVENYLVILLKEIREADLKNSKKIDASICKVVAACQNHGGNEGYLSVSKNGETSAEREHVLYREGLLNKFVLESLLLSITRKEPTKELEELISALSAGIAMFLYVVLLFIYGRAFIVDATALVIVTVFLYVMRERLKESLKNFYKGIAFRLFPDFTTKILTPDNSETIGEQKEFFTFLSRNKIPVEILKIREKAFHKDLEDVRRQENIIYYKKKVSLNAAFFEVGKNIFKELHDIFRFNINGFLIKASDPSEDFYELDPKSFELVKVNYPKVYHLNIIIQLTSLNAQHEKQIKYKNVRIILNKEGIVRIERLKPLPQKESVPLNPQHE